MRLIARALRPHPDGRVWGWRALVPNARVKAFERQSRPRVLVHTKAGQRGRLRSAAHAVSGTGDGPAA